MSDVTFYKNKCPFCESTDVVMTDEYDTDGNKLLKCNKCEKEFRIYETKKEMVGDTSNL